MCNKRISIAYAVELGILPKSYLNFYGKLVESYTIRAFQRDNQYFIEDPLTRNYRQISEETYRRINGNIKKPKRPSRRTK